MKQLYGFLSKDSDNAKQGQAIWKMPDGREEVVSFVLNRPKNNTRWNDATCIGPVSYLVKSLPASF